MRKLKYLIILFLFCVSSVSFSQKLFYDEKVQDWRSLEAPEKSQITHSVLLIGDIVHPNEDSTVIDLMKEKITSFGPSSSVLVLGDIVYPKGIPEEEDPLYEDAKRDMDMILDRFNDYEGEVVFMPGNHDWKRGAKDGWERLGLMEKYIEVASGIQNVFLPDNGCPGPVEVELSDDVLAIIFDSQWWFQNNDKPGPDDGCEFEDITGIFVQIEDIIRRNQDKHIIFAAHHPLFSVGYHGGYFPAEYNLFPFLEFNKALYIPFPGFIYTGYRKYLGHVQDMAHPEYKIFKQKMLETFQAYPNIIYAAGHEHNLQYFKYDSLHQIISGGGGEGTYISKRKKKTDFAADTKGLSIVNFYENGEAWVEYWTPDDTESGELLFKYPLYQKGLNETTTTNNDNEVLNFSDSTVRAKLTDLYLKGGFINFLMGENYREIWNTEVELPVFDIEKEKGGLKILKRGGGQQTRSIRMKAADGKQYVLRSVNKYVEKALDKELWNTIAEDAVQDGISASNPYAALTIPKMANAIGIYHTNPKYVWVPDDPALGIYRRDMANDIYLFEERPAGKAKDMPNFGNSKELVNTAEVIEKTLGSHDHLVDQKAVLKARLFDFLINDWDRHDDQWRWATFKKDGKKIYRPIPRDRDQTYFVNQGVLMWVVKQDFILPKFQGFDYEIKNIKGLGFNARYFDRAFLSEPGLEDWIQAAAEIQEDLTDEVIEEAIHDFPPEIYAKLGKDTEDKLKQRRDDLQKYADEYYRFLSKSVDVVGTSDRDFFKIKRLENGHTDVKIFAMSQKKGKKRELLYHRDFDPDVTREIRLYGKGDKDKFEIEGEADKAIKIRLIGGKDTDKYKDESHIKGLGKSIIVYDRRDRKNKIKKGNETRLKLSNSKSVYKYDRKQFKYNRTAPIIGGGYNVDDGIFIGGGINMKRFNFRDSTSHKLSGTYAFLTNAFSVDYAGSISSFSQYFSLEIEANVSMPRNVDNFFGMGNETKKITDDRSYYRVRYGYMNLNPMLMHKFSEKVNYSIGGFYRYFNVQDTAGKYIGDINLNQLDSSAFEQAHYAGLNARFEVDTRNSEVLTQRGMHWITDVSGNFGIHNDNISFIRLRSDLNFYISSTIDPRVVLALRFGGAMNIGDYEFYNANALGGRTNLRGYQSRRFTGDHTAYQSTELRFKLMNLSSYLFNGQIGIYGFNDLGRVWYEGENSKKWHHGYGFGIWVIPFEFTALTVSYDMSEEDQLISFNFRFLF